MLRPLLFNVRYKTIMIAKGHAPGGTFECDTFSIINEVLHRYFSYLHKDLFKEIHSNENVISVSLKDYDSINSLLQEEDYGESVRNMSRLFQALFLMKTETYLAKGAYVTEMWKRAMDQFYDESNRISVTCSPKLILDGMASAWVVMLWMLTEDNKFGKYILAGGLEGIVDCTEDLFSNTEFTVSNKNGDYHIEYTFPKDYLRELNSLCSFYKVK